MLSSSGSDQRYSLAFFISMNCERPIKFFFAFFYKLSRNHLLLIMIAKAYVFLWLRIVLYTVQHCHLTSHHVQISLPWVYPFWLGAIDVRFSLVSLGTVLNKRRHGVKTYAPGAVFTASVDRKSRGYMWISGNFILRLRNILRMIASYRLQRPNEVWDFRGFKLVKIPNQCMHFERTHSWSSYHDHSLWS